MDGSKCVLHCVTWYLHLNGPFVVIKSQKKNFLNHLKSNYNMFNVGIEYFCVGKCYCPSVLSIITTIVQKFCILFYVQSLLKYQGPSSNYHLLGFIEKSQFIFRLVEKILVSLQASSSTETDCMAVLETVNLFVSKIPGIIQK